MRGTGSSCGPYIAFIALWLLGLTSAQAGLSFEHYDQIDYYDWRNNAAITRNATRYWISVNGIAASLRGTGRKSNTRIMSGKRTGITRTRNRMNKRAL